MITNSSELRIGAVFQPDWDSRPIRVIAFDEVQVMYDCWWPHIPGWGIESLNRAVSYYRIPLHLLLNRSRYLRTEEYTQAELSVHRPDLPFSFAQFADLEWPSNCPATPEDFPDRAFSCRKDGASKYVLDAAKIYLHPFGPKGSFKPSVLLEAENGSGFTVKEILRHAARLQSQYLREIKVTAGIGIYRSGIQRKLPSYYIWGAKSHLET